MLATNSGPVPKGFQNAGDAPAGEPIHRSEIVVLMQEIERMQARFARRNNSSWVHACDTLLCDCRKLLEDGEG